MRYRVLDSRPELSSGSQPSFLIPPAGIERFCLGLRRKLTRGVTFDLATSAAPHAKAHRNPDSRDARPSGDLVQLVVPL